MCPAPNVWFGAAGSVTAMASFDVVIRGGDVVDGTGAARRRADVGVSGAAITAVGDLTGAPAVEEIDATGKVVSPGFIDVHAHTDMVVALPDEQAALKRTSVVQGVTSEVSGNCGFTPFPTDPTRRDDFARHLDGLFHGHGGGFATMAEYRDYINDAGHAVNLAPLLGHGSLRAGVMGMEDRAPTDEELERMRVVADRAFEEGAFGLSSGLIYPPGVYSRTEELCALAEVAGRYGRPYATHMRDEADGVVTSIEEALRIGREGRTGVQISHHKVAGPENWGRSEETLELLEKARAEGTDVTIDVYPYTAGCTFLAATLPPWVSAGGAKNLVERLQDPATAAQVAGEVKQGREGWQSFVDKVGWDSIVISSAPLSPEHEGRNVIQVGEALGVEPFEAARQLLVTDPGVMMIIHMMHEDDVRRIVSAGFAMIGSDGDPAPGKPHPRLAGTFARVLGHYCRELRLFSLEEAVRKMTSLPASRFNLADRGVIAEDKAADLVVFDPMTVIDRATYDDPLLPPTGVDTVLVNGKVAVRSGADTGVRSGQVLSPA